VLGAFAAFVAVFVTGTALTVFAETVLAARVFPGSAVDVFSDKEDAALVAIGFRTAVSGAAFDPDVTFAALAGAAALTGAAALAAFAGVDLEGVLAMAAGLDFVDVICAALFALSLFIGFSARGFPAGGLVAFDVAFRTTPAFSAMASPTYKTVHGGAPRTP
jgi:hypothetical protein